MTKTYPSNILVSGMQWHIEEMPQCCGATVLCRLEACYHARAGIVKKIKDMQKLSINFSFTPLTQIASLSDHVQSKHYSPWLAIPVKLAYASVLEHLIDNRCNKDKLFLVTDNVSRPLMGDVMLGPFSSRNFVRWLEREGLADVHRGATARNNWQDAYSTYHTKSITTWSFTIKDKVAKACIKSATADVLAWYNRISKQFTQVRESIKTPTTATTRRVRREAEDYIGAFASATTTGF